MLLYFIECIIFEMWELELYYFIPVALTYNKRVKEHVMPAGTDVH